MYLRRCYRARDGKRHAYWALVKSVRTAKGPRQQVVAYLGRLSPRAARSLTPLANAAATPPAGNVGYWSDGGAISHSITTPSSAATYTAAFNAQYLLTTTVAPGGTLRAS